MPAAYPINSLVALSGNDHERRTHVRTDGASAHVHSSLLCRATLQRYQVEVLRIALMAH